jgi:hypothetical protein
LQKKIKVARCFNGGRQRIAVDKIARESAAKQKKLDEENAKVKKFYANQRIDFGTRDTENQR